MARSAPGRTTHRRHHAYAWDVSAVYAWLSRHPRLVDGVPAVLLFLLGLASGVGQVTERRVGPGGPVPASPPVSAYGARPALLLLLLILLGLAVPVVFRRKYPVQAF